MEYYIHCLKNYANFDGRARRSEYWYFVLFNVIISVALSMIGLAIKTTLLSNIYSFAVFIPGLAAGVRRMHDVGKSGWYLLIPIYSLILALTDSEPGNNAYGPNPKDPNPEPFK